MRIRIAGVTFVTLLALGCGGGKARPDAAAGGSGGGDAGIGSEGGGGAAAGQSGSGGEVTSSGGVSGRGGSGGTGASGRGGSNLGAGSGGASGRGGAGNVGAGSGGASGRGGSNLGAGSGGAGSGGASGATGGGGGGGRGGMGGGSPAGVSHLGCTFIGGINRVVVSRRDTAGNVCLSVALREADLGAQPAPGLMLPTGWQLERVTAGPASSCPSRNGSTIAAEVTGTVSWAQLRPGSSSYPSHAHVDLTVAVPAGDAGPPSTERLVGQNVDVQPGCDAAPNQCSFALPLRCGDRLSHSTVTQGRLNAWSAYGKTARALWGRETVYSFSSASTCTVVANLKNLATDLDLLLLSACDPLASNEMVSSTPLDLQTTETIQWTNLPDQISYLVVDGYAGAEGSYSLEVDCTCR